MGFLGHVIVTADQAALWTDGRYWNVGDEELDCNWILMKQGASSTWQLIANTISTCGELLRFPSIHYMPRLLFSLSTRVCADKIKFLVWV